MNAISVSTINRLRKQRYHSDYMYLTKTIRKTTITQFCTGPSHIANRAHGTAIDAAAISIIWAVQL